MQNAFAVVAGEACLQEFKESDFKSGQTLDGYAFLQSRSTVQAIKQHQRL